MAETTTTELKKGRVTAVQGPVVDVTFARIEDMPDLHEVVMTKTFDKRQLTLEVAYSLLDTLGQPYGFVLLPLTENGRIAIVRVGWQLQPQKEMSPGVST